MSQQLVSLRPGDLISRSCLSVCWKVGRSVQNFLAFQNVIIQESNNIIEVSGQLKPIRDVVRPLHGTFVQ